jgi:hypothetical protein
MALRTRALLGALLAAVVVTGGCGGDDDSTAVSGLGPNSTSFDPGPNSTSFDPGPNPTDEGPRTVDGTLQITGECLTLQRADGNLDLRFDGYEANGDALADDTGTVIARNGDTILVAGHPADETGPCGRRFDVDSFVSVIAKK